MTKKQKEYAKAGFKEESIDTQENMDDDA